MALMLIDAVMSWNAANVSDICRLIMERPSRAGLNSTTENNISGAKGRQITGQVIAQVSECNRDDMI